VFARGGAGQAGKRLCAAELDACGHCAHAARLHRLSHASRHSVMRVGTLRIGQLHHLHLPPP